MQTRESEDKAIRSSEDNAFTIGRKKPSDNLNSVVAVQRSAGCLLGNVRWWIKEKKLKKKKHTGKLLATMRRLLIVACKVIIRLISSAAMQKKLPKKPAGK